MHFAHRCEKSCGKDHCPSDLRYRDSLRVQTVDVLPSPDVLSDQARPWRNRQLKVAIRQRGYCVLGWSVACKRKSGAEIGSDAAEVVTSRAQFFHKRGSSCLRRSSHDLKGNLTKYFANRTSVVQLAGKLT